MTLYQSPGVTSPCAQTPFEKYGRKILVGHHAVVPEPVGVRALQSNACRQPVETGIQAEAARELVAHDREDVLLVRWVHGPEEDVVNQLRIAHPALEEDHDAMREQVVAAVHRVLDTQVVRERLRGGHLVDVANQRVAADRQRPALPSCRPGSRRRDRTRPTSQSEVARPEDDPGSAAGPVSLRIDPARTRRRSYPIPTRRSRRNPRSCPADTLRCRSIASARRPPTCRRRSDCVRCSWTHR